MAILEHKEIFDDSKKVFKNFDKELEKINTDIVTLTKSSKKLADALQLVEKSSDGKEAKKLADGTNKLTQSTKKLKDALTAEERVKQQILRANVKLAQSRTKAAKDLALVRQETLKQNRALNQQAKAQLGVKKGLSSLTKQMFAGFGIIAGFRALGRIITNALKIYKDFEKESSRLAAIVGKSKDEIKSLTDQAKLLGSTTAFTAKQVIELQIELGKLGFSLKEIEASTPGILDLAAATGTDLASAAELAGATLRIFNLDASQMSRVTDVLALSTTKSSLSMEKLATILPTVGKTAQIAGISLEQTAALAGTLTDRGLDASTAATSLRNIFLELSKQGITWNEAMTKINESTNKNKTSMDLFGKRAASAGVILSETAESTDELTIALNDANGAAKRMADTMLDNLAGDVTKAGSAWEGFINSLITGDGVMSKILRKLVTTGTAILGFFTKLNQGQSVSLIRMKNIQNVEAKLIKFREKHIKILETLNTDQEKKIKLEGRAAISSGELVVVERKLKREREGSLELSKSEKTQLEFKRDVLKSQIDILNSLIPLEKSNNVAIETSGTETKETAAQLKKRIKAEEDLIKTLRKKDLVAPIESKAGKAEVTAKQKLEDDKALIEENARVNKEEADTEEFEKILERAQAQADAELAIKEQLETSAVQLASDIFNSFQDEKLARLQSDAEAQKAILQQRLDDGIISEEQFAAQSAAIDKKFRLESAKADRNKALFDITIRTAVAVISALTSIPPNVPLSIAAGIIGGIQAAAVLAAPLNFAEGTESVPGTGNKDTVPAMLTPGERIVPTEINQMLNGIPNSDLPKLLNKQDNNMLLANILMNNNDTSKQILTVLLNGGHFVPRNGQIEYIRADGTKEIFLAK